MMDIFCSLCPFYLYRNSDLIEYTILRRTLEHTKIRVGNKVVVLDRHGKSKDDYYAVNTFEEPPVRKDISSSPIYESARPAVNDLYRGEDLVLDKNMELILVVLKSLSEKYKIPWEMPEITIRATHTLVWWTKTSGMALHINTTDITELFYRYARLMVGRIR